MYILVYYCIPLPSTILVPVLLYLLVYHVSLNNCFGTICSYSAHVTYFQLHIHLMNRLVKHFHTTLTKYHCRIAHYAYIHTYMHTHTHIHNISIYYLLSLYYSVLSITPYTFPYFLYLYTSLCISLGIVLETDHYSPLQTKHSVRNEYCTRERLHS